MWSLQNTILHHISKRPDTIPQIAQWYQEEWATLNPEATIESRRQELEEKKDLHSLPLTMVLMAHDEILGTYSLDLSDLTTRPHLSPWLASVFVNPQYRGQGIGTLLVKEALKQAKGLGVQTLYLFTSDQAHWYAAMGFIALEELIFHGEMVTLMQFSNKL